MLTTPRWQTPWYKRQRINLGNWPDPVNRPSNDSNVVCDARIVEERTVFKITDDSGVERVYHSLDEMPAELRAAVKKAMDGRGTQRGDN